MELSSSMGCQRGVSCCRQLIILWHVSVLWFSLQIRIGNLVVEVVIYLYRIKASIVWRENHTLESNSNELSVYFVPISRCGCNFGENWKAPNSEETYYGSIWKRRKKYHVFSWKVVCKLCKQGGRKQISTEGQWSIVGEIGMAFGWWFIWILGKGGLLQVQYRGVWTANLSRICSRLDHFGEASWRTKRLLSLTS